MNYSPHLKRIEETFGKIPYNEEWTDFEKCVILLRTKGCSYGDIQSYLGNPSKKLIRQTLLKYTPELIDLDCNRHKLKAGPVKSIEKRLINLLKSKNQWSVETDEDIFDFEIKDDKLIMSSDLYGNEEFLSWDITTQNQIFNLIQKSINDNSEN